jgi:hypothetical protein
MGKTNTSYGCNAKDLVPELDKHVSYVSNCLTCNLKPTLCMPSMYIS